MNKNGKNKFYRTLNLDKKEKQALKFYTEIKKEMDKDDEDVEDDE